MGYINEKRIRDLYKIDIEFAGRTGHIAVMRIFTAKMYRLFYALYHRLDHIADRVAACQIFGGKVENPAESGLGVCDHCGACGGYSARIRRRRQAVSGNGQFYQ